MSDETRWAEAQPVTVRDMSGTVDLEWTVDLYLAAGTRRVATVVS